MKKINSLDQLKENAREIKEHTCFGCNYVFDCEFYKEGYQTAIKDALSKVPKKKEVKKINGTRAGIYGFNKCIDTITKELKKLKEI